MYAHRQILILQKRKTSVLSYLVTILVQIKKLRITLVIKHTKTIFKLQHLLHQICSQYLLTLNIYNLNFSKEHGELCSKSRVGHYAPWRQLGRHAHRAGVFGTPQPSHAHHATALVRWGLHAFHRHLLFRWRPRPVSQT